MALLQKNRELIEQKTGAPICVRRIAVRDLAKRRAVDVDRSIITSNPSDIIDDPEIQIVCELIGGVSPAREYVLRAIRDLQRILEEKGRSAAIRTAP